MDLLDLTMHKKFGKDASSAFVARSPGMSFHSRPSEDLMMEFTLFLICSHAMLSDQGTNVPQIAEEKGRRTMYVNESLMQCWRVHQWLPNSAVAAFVVVLAPKRVRAPFLTSGYNNFGLGEASTSQSQPQTGTAPLCEVLFSLVEP